MAQGSKNKQQGQRRGTGTSRPPPNPTNSWDVCVRIIDALYDLAQTGNLLGLITFGVITLGFYVTYRLPSETIGGLLHSFGAFLTSEKYYLFPLLSALAVSVAANIIQDRVYRRHIKDLTDHRKYLVHGLKEGALKQLKIHTSSGFDIETD